MSDDVPPDSSVAALLATGVLVADGAMGTMLHAAGNALDQALPALNLTDPALVSTIHDAYVDAGVDLLQTNTFGAGRLRLTAHGFGEQTVRLNAVGVALARAAADRAGRRVLVAGSVAPAVGSHQRGRFAEGPRRAAVAEQVAALVGEGVDVVLLETFGHLDELVEAVEAALEVAAAVPVIAQATFGPDHRTLSGHDAGAVVAALAALPVAAVGVNCTLGPQGCLAILEQLRAHTARPLAAQPNAGLPRRVGPGRFTYEVDIDYFARYTRRLIAAGAGLVGGCCGTTPGQLAAAVEVAAEIKAEAAAAAKAAGTSTNGSATTVRGATGTAARDRAAAPPKDGPLPAVEHVIAVELDPALVGRRADALELVGRLVAGRDGREGVDVVCVPPVAGARSRRHGIDLAVAVQDRFGLAAMAGIATRDRTIMSLQADLLGAHALGVRTLVCETGTAPLLGDYPQADGTWDVDSLGLVELLAGLNDGVDHHGLALPSRAGFRIGARVNPGSREPGRAVADALDKINAGAQFFITRTVFELSGVERVLAAVDGRVPVLVAVRPLTGVDEADYLAHEVPDVTMPASVVATLARAGSDAARAGIDMAVELADRIRELADGVVVTGGDDVLGVLRRIRR